MSNYVFHWIRSSTYIVGLSYVVIIYWNILITFLPEEVDPTGIIILYSATLFDYITIIVPNCAAFQLLFNIIIDGFPVTKLETFQPGRPTSWTNIAIVGNIII